MAENPFARFSTEQEIKRAYRKLCLTCHPDVRPDKESATEEFRELTRIYEVALSMIGKVQPPPKPKKQPSPPPPKPTGPITDTARIVQAEEFDMFFGVVTRTALAKPEIMVYGGIMTIEIMDVSMMGIVSKFSFDVPINTPNGQKFRFQMPYGPLEITLVMEHK